MNPQQQRRNNMRSNRPPREPKEFEEKVVQVNRVSKKTKGGNKMGFSVLVVVGNKKGKVGVGMGKAKDVATSVQKAVKKAKRRLLEVPMQGTTIPFAIDVKFGAARIMLKPAPPGSGIIAGGAVRAVVDAAGIRDISSKIKGTSNKASNVYTTLEALRQIRRLVDKKGIQLRSVAQAEQMEKVELREKTEQRAEVKPVVVKNMPAALQAAVATKTLEAPKTKGIEKTVTVVAKKVVAKKPADKTAKPKKAKV